MKSIAYIKTPNNFIIRVDKKEVETFINELKCKMTTAKKYKKQQKILLKLENLSIKLGFKDIAELFDVIKNEKLMLKHKLKVVQDNSKKVYLIHGNTLHSLTF